MSQVDRVQKIILRLKNLGQEQILSKIRRLNEGLKVKRLSDLTEHMAVQPAGTTFERYVTVIKNLADAFFPIANYRNRSSRLFNCG